MKYYGLNLNEDKRILSACLISNPAITEGATEINGMPVVTELPKGDITEYLYRDGEFIHDPLPEPVEPEPEPTQLDMVEAQALYTAMMTDTLL